MPSTPLGNAPIREVIVDLQTGKPTAGFAKWISTLAAKFMLADDSADSTGTTISITSSNATSVSSPNATLVVGTALFNGWGFTSEAEFNTAITDINTIRTLANEIRLDYNASVTLINELKTDVNTLSSDLNTLVTSINELKTNLRAAGIIA